MSEKDERPMTPKEREMVEQIRILNDLTHSWLMNPTKRTEFVGLIGWSIDK